MLFRVAYVHLWGLAVCSARCSMLFQGMYARLGGVAARAARLVPDSDLGSGSLVRPARRGGALPAVTRLLVPSLYSVLYIMIS
jgi:hypothetical protein